MIQKIMELCDCPIDVCRADRPPQNCRFVMDPHDKQRQMAKEIARKLKRGDQYERDDPRAAAAQLFTPEQIASGKFSGGRLMNFKEGWAIVIGTHGKAHYFTIDDRYKGESADDKLARSACRQVRAFINDKMKDQFGFLYGAGNVDRCGNCKRELQKRKTHVKHFLSPIKSTRDFR